MTGKDKCKILKELRAEIALKNDIEWTVSECRHKGNCKGTCPKCEAEVRKLEAELERRKNLGKAVAVAGLSIASLMPLTACTFGPNDTDDGYDESISGDIMVSTEDYIDPGEENTEEYTNTEDCTNTEECTNTEGIYSTEDTEEITELEGDVAYPEDLDD